MTIKRFKQLMRKQKGEPDPTELTLDGDPVVCGLLIICKYIDPATNPIIECTDREHVYSEVTAEQLVAAGITEEDIVALKRLWWTVTPDGYLNGSF